MNKRFSVCSTRRLLYSVLPISVANELRHSRPVPAKKYDCVTLLFSGIVGFGAYCAAHTDSNGAMKIVNMLNELYTAFDVLTDPKKNPNVYKVNIYNKFYFFLFLYNKDKSVYDKKRDYYCLIYKRKDVIDIFNKMLKKSTYIFNLIARKYYCCSHVISIIINILKFISDFHCS